MELAKAKMVHAEVAFSVTRFLSADYLEVHAVLGQATIENIAQVAEDVFPSGDPQRIAAEMFLQEAFPEFGSTILEQMLQILVYASYCVRQGSYSGLLFQFIEYFSGMASMTREMAKLGVRVACFDSLYDPSHDCEIGAGFRRWVVTLLCTAVGASTWLGFECKSWLWLTRSVTKRSKTNVWGDITVSCVNQGNEQIVKVSLLGVLAHLVKVGTVFEQPLSSCADKAPCFSKLLASLHARRTVTWLGCFGFTSAKPLKLWHTQAWVGGLKRSRPSRGSFKRFKPLCYKNRHGKVCGYSAQLKKSAAYTKEFGRSAAQLFKNRRVAK